MTGLIWIIQILHYPSYKYIAPEKFQSYQDFHMKSITFLVAPIMLLEVFSGLYLLIENQFEFKWSLEFGLLILIWLATAFLSVPNHEILKSGYNESVVDSLVNTNWVRTILWTARSAGFMFLVFKQIK
jgi:hypothetical protein